MAGNKAIKLEQLKYIKQYSEDNFIAKSSVGDGLNIDETGKLNVIVEGLTVDDALSDTSEHPVQNKVIKAALDEKANKSEIPTSLPANGGNANTVNGHTVYSDVPENAKFTDTTYPAASTTTMGLVTTGTQEFGGTKYFANLFIKHGVDLGIAPSADSSKFVAFTGVNGHVTTDFAHLVNVVRTTGVNELHLTLRAPTSKKAKNMISAIISADDSAYAAAVISPSSPDWSALRNLASGSAAATTSNCPDGAWYGQYEEV